MQKPHSKSQWKWEKARTGIPKRQSKLAPSEPASQTPGSTLEPSHPMGGEDPFLRSIEHSTA